MTEHLPECPKSGCAACCEQGQRDALAAARRIVAGFLDIDETGDHRCADPTCELCVVAPLIYAALEDLSKGAKTRETTQPRERAERSTRAGPRQPGG